MRHPLLDLEAIGALEPHLRAAGRVFAVFPHQDSGCVGYGVAIGGERWFVKTARVPDAEPSLRRAVAFHGAVRHPVLIPLRHTLTADDRLTLVYPWVDGENLNPATDPKGMGRANPDGALARLRRRPVDEVLGVVDQLLDAHVAVELAGYVAVDLYDGCMLYDFPGRALRLCDLDEYRPGPFVLDGDRLPGSRRFMAPEEWRRGATIDRRTTVFNLGRAARLLLDAGNDERAWRGTPALLAVIDRATRPDPDLRYPSVGALTGAWRAAARTAPDAPER